MAMAEKTPWERLAGVIGAGDSKIIPELLETLADETEAELLLAAAPPATVEELSRQTGLEPGEVEEMIDPLFRKGLLFKSKKKDAQRYYRVRHLFQLHDSTAVMNDPPREMLDLWKQHMAEEWDDLTEKIKKADPRSTMRVIPVNVAVEPDTQILAFEDVRRLITDSRNLAVTRCSCRVIDGACGKPLEVCIQIDRAADYAIDRGTGRKLSKDAAMAVLKMCEQEGLVHAGENRQASGHVICNCCPDCCINWVQTPSGMRPVAVPSRFRASVDVEECTGCGDCVDRCFFGAIRMEDGDGVATVDGDTCMGCGLCQVVCPPVAIRMEVARPEEFVPA
jgi:Pyruvate/2-oxoacid:ferredoxin oxidoreductase delta subunit/predicted transcriptional regulator